MEDFIQLKKDSILRIGIKDQDGKDTGEHLEFDLEDLELAFKLDECYKQHELNVKQVQGEIIAIKKRKDTKGKGILTKNEEDQIKAINKFYGKEQKALDLFLGENGTKKLLNGRKPYIGMFEDITEYIKPIIPKLHLKQDDIIKKVKNKYSQKEENVIE